MNTVPRIDAHMHWWNIARGDYGWLTPDLTALFHDFGPVQAEPLLAAAAIDAIILVQAAPTLAETLWLLDQARSRAYVLGVVGWADLRDAAEVEALVRIPHVLGLRPMLTDMAAVDWILDPAHAPALRLLEELRLPFEALITPAHLPVIRQLILRYPHLRVMVDHAAKPDIAGRDMRSWRVDLASLASSSSVWCKLSGLVTEAPRSTAPRRFAPYVEVILDLFGADRVVWGSDWPVSTQRIDYSTWLRWVEQYIAALSAAQRAGIFGGNALRFYTRTDGGSAIGSIRPNSST